MILIIQKAKCKDFGIANIFYDLVDEKEESIQENLSISCEGSYNVQVADSVQKILEKHPGIKKIFITAEQMENQKQKYFKIITRRGDFSINEKGEIK